MEILLDTNFILTSTKQKLDFFSLANELFDENISWIIPKEVIEELKDLSKRKGEKERDKQAAKISLELLNKHKTKKVKLKGDTVDEGLVNYSNKHEIILATLDKKLKSKAKSGTLTIRGKKNLILN
jgi:rRNA-processing protein FCF1